VVTWCSGEFFPRKSAFNQRKSARNFLADVSLTAKATKFLRKGREEKINPPFSIFNPPSSDFRKTNIKFLLNHLLMAKKVVLLPIQIFILKL